MRQLVQKLKDGWMGVIDVPPPVVSDGRVLVRCHHSVISPGTEGGTVSAARKSLLGKARERPEQVRQVIETLKQQGPQQTYRAVMKKLDSYSPLGYSAAGEVIGVHASVTGFAVGDRVACAGAGYANHAEIVSVPANLCVKLAPDADLAAAAYNTLGAIALQGIRQADLALGETGVVIGLGLLGHLTALMLRAGGVKVIGLDIDAARVALAAARCADHAFTMHAPGLAPTVDALTRGIGADAVIITAATSSLEPINLAGRLLRKRGTVVIVGDVPAGFDRDPYFYRKELAVKMSCSYGPGRYDPAYEEKGIDYPPGYVRWTERRNMDAFQDMLHAGRIDIAYLTTHRFALEAAPKAYDLIVNRSEAVLGILIDYPRAAAAPAKRVAIREPGQRPPPGALGISFVGAGSYAMSHLLPNIRPSERIVLQGVMTASGASSRTVAEKYGFAFATADPNDILCSDETTTVFIATRHDTHAELVIEALNNDKHVFVEKPLCLTEAQLAAIRDAHRACEERGGRARLMVGFNRRFAPLALALKRAIGAGPLSALYRVNAGAIAADSWIQDPAVGGGRIVGEACHFIDFLTFLTGALPVRVYAAAMADAGAHDDVVSLTLSFADGSVGTIGYYANGAKSLAKEYVEVYRAGVTAVLSDFKELTIHGAGRPKRSRLLNQDKGQAAMVGHFLAAALAGGAAPIAFAEIEAVTEATFAAMDSLRTNAAVRIGAEGAAAPLAADDPGIALSGRAPQR